MLWYGGWDVWIESMYMWFMHEDVATTDYGHTNMWYSQMSKKSASTKERFATFFG